MSGPDSFGGEWLVCEYVYDPDGTYRGTVSQRRDVTPITHERLRVRQHCEPSPELSSHAMAAFAGEWVFDLELAGDERCYVGPDVVGHGTQWQPGVMTGQGLWPRFGHEFESYGVLVAPDRQLTGGSFSLAGRLVADVVGVAVAAAGGAAPRLDLSAPPPEADPAAMLHRSVGPMLMAVAWPSHSQRQRWWAMRDRIAGTGFTLTENIDGGTRRVRATVG
ncbi:hypothetical protein [Candidatus Poriferisodalis sp.]|uniref:hypothetical protein n=1 Tax=Candidatus Poriferisodalis sp. TaxID=3101277 RepID=UPI003B024972